VNSVDRLRALVLVSHGATARVRLPDGTEVLARAAGRDLQFACGDEAYCQYDARHDQWQVQAVAPRRSALFRTNARGRPELVAANVSCLAIVIAPLPEPDLFVVDRYLAAAHSAGMTALLLTNKADLQFTSALCNELAAYGQADCELLACSAHSCAGLDALRTRLRAQVSMLVGQSGVGKSSLLRALVPGCEPAIGELLKSEEGRHTTSTSCLYELPGGGALIDSPGVRDFAPALEHLDARTLGFAEVARLAPECRFADCAHLLEPDCAVRQAVAAGSFSARRYESYRRLYRLRQQLRERAPRGRKSH
jgi:ribosome biogenesis GTPase / thiamine phosphate phosphatase